MNLLKYTRNSTSVQYLHGPAGHGQEIYPETRDASGFKLATPRLVCTPPEGHVDYVSIVGNSPLFLFSFSFSSTSSSSSSSFHAKKKKEKRRKMRIPSGKGVQIDSRPKKGRERCSLEGKKNPAGKGERFLGYVSGGLFHGILFNKDIPAGFTTKLWDRRLDELSPSSCRASFREVSRRAVKGGIG